MSQVRPAGLCDGCPSSGEASGGWLGRSHDMRHPRQGRIRTLPCPHAALPPCRRPCLRDPLQAHGLDHGAVQRVLRPRDRLQACLPRSPRDAVHPTARHLCVPPVRDGYGLLRSLSLTTPLPGSTAAWHLPAPATSPPSFPFLPPSLPVQQGGDVGGLLCAAPAAAGHADSAAGSHRPPGAFRGSGLWARVGGAAGLAAQACPAAHVSAPHIPRP